MLLVANPFAPIFGPLVEALGQGLTAIHAVIPSYGWALIALAAVVRLVLWPLQAIQTRSMAQMQKVAPLVKQLQTKYKGDQQRIQQETMALYKEHNVNPLAGCLPLVLQFPILIGLFYAIQSRISTFNHEHWLWIGSGFSQALAKTHPGILATSLAVPDVLLLGLYVISMYFSVRFGSPPAADPQQAQTQKIMAFLSPAMIAFFGFKYRWASALYIYWLASNVFTVAQQIFLYRRYGIWGHAAQAQAAAAALPANGKAPKPSRDPSSDGAASKPNGKTGSRAKKARR